MKIISTFLLMLTISIASKAQTTKEQIEIQATLTRFFEGLSNLNDTDIKAETSSDFTLVEHGLIWNADSLINHLKPMKSLNVKRVNQFVFDKTDQMGNVAIVVYHNTANISVGDKKQTAKWLESAVLIKESGKWKIKLLHSTDLK